MSGIFPRTVSSSSAPPLRELYEWIRGDQGGIPRAAVALFAMYVVWMLAVPPAPAHGFISELYNVVVPLAAAVSAWQTSHHPALDPRTRQGWLACAMGFFALMVGSVIWLVYDYVIGQRPVVSIADVMYLAYYPALLWGLLRFPTTRRSKGEIVKLWLDVGTVVIVVWAIIWYLVLDPLIDEGSSTMLSVILAGAYPVSDLAFLFTSAALLLRGIPSVSLRAVQMLALAGVTMFGSDLILGYKVVHTGMYQMGSWTDLGWQFAMMLWFLATLQQRWSATRRTNELSPAQEMPVTISIIPYATVLVGYGLLLIAVWPYWTSVGETLMAVLLLTALVIARQIIEVRENVQLLNERVTQEARFRSLVQNSSDVITVVDEHGIIQFMSPSVERVFGWLPSESLGMHVTNVVHHDDAIAVSDFMTSLQSKDGLSESKSLIIRCRNRVGQWLFIETIATILIDDPVIRGIVLNTRDVSERMALQAKLSHQAYHDSLTQLPNRSWFHTQVENALEHSWSSPGHVAVFFLDLDNFKNINDSLGHAAGDAILIEVAGRLLNATRGSDTVARLGGDEFAILVNRVASEADLVIIAGRITNAMRAPFMLHNSEVFSSVSIGIARGDIGQNVDDLLRNADVAMYVSKRQGRGAHTIFVPQMHTQARERLGLEIDLRHALMREELTLLFQPIVALATRRLLGVEALVRWMHPQRGLLMPTEFIPIAEETGLILSLGRWVLREACRQGVRWHSMLPSGTSFIISVNVSGRQLEHVAFIEEVAAALKDTGFPPNDLLLEVTESVIARDTEATLGQLKALKMLGIKIAIDDFGTGYSSLSVLQQFPADVLKIDKSFVNEAIAEEHGLAVAQTIVALGKALSLHTVAEGIEHLQQADILSAMGCEAAQGYYFSRPIQPAEIDAFIKLGSIIEPVASYTDVPVIAGMIAD